MKNSLTNLIERLQKLKSCNQNGNFLFNSPLILIEIDFHTQNLSQVCQSIVEYIDKEFPYSKKL